MKKPTKQLRGLGEQFENIQLEIQEGAPCSNVFDDLVEHSKEAKEVSILENIAAFYKEKKEFKSEFETLEIILAIKEEAFENEKQEKIVALQNTFESQERDRLIKQQLSFNKSLNRKNKALSNALAKHKRMELHLKSLQLQLSPHFIFNTLQSIQSFIFQKDAIEASDYLAKFAILIRAILKASRQDALTIAEEVQLLSQYLELEQKRFDESFQYEVLLEHDLDLEKELIPSLLLQPFIENAILHGIVGKKDGLVKVVFRKRGPLLYVHIIDNGVGRKVAKTIHKRTHQGSSTALKILTERAALSAESKRFTYHFTIRDERVNREVVGTHVLIRVQNKIKEEVL
jgi:sensor histidine kinase YesM